MKEILYDKYKSFLTWFGDLYFATEPPLIKAEEIRMADALLQPGDVICRGYNYYLDSHFIPGDYSHSGLVVDQSNMIHAVAEGVSKIDIIDFIKDVDRFIVLRPNLSQSELADVLDRAFEHLEHKRPYDFTFKDPNNFYCHEFTQDCLNCGGIEILPTEKRFGIGIFSFKRTLFLAQNLIDALQTIYEFNPEQKEEVNFETKH